MSVLFSYSFFYLAFLPLWVSILFVDIKSIIEGNKNLGTEYISILCILIFCLISLVNLFFEVRAGGEEGTQSQRILRAQEEKSITVEYLLSYILPLFAFDFTKWDQVVLFLVFFLTLGFLCIKNNYFCVNIVLELMGYKFFACSLENEDDVKTEQIVISQRHLRAYVGQDVYLKALNNEYKIDVGKKRKE